MKEMTIKIVIPSGADSIELKAAKQLQHYLFEMSQTEINIVEEDASNNGNGIFLGHTNYAKTQNIDFNQLEEDGYSYKNNDGNFIIAGGSKKGLLHGVYDDWGLFVHTFQTLIPPKKYGKTHPEYFSLIDGERSPVTQLCLSNEEVFDTVVSELKKRIAKNPKSKYWSISQNDNDKYCQCELCTKLNKKYGGVPSGSMTWFVNKVAREFPDKVISTLAYWYSRSAPSNLEIEPNVNIMLCNIESTREQPVFVTDSAFSNDLQGWGKISQDILIWDYNIQFASPVSPFPNFHTIGPNIKFYTNNNVKSLFMQATSRKGEFGHLEINNS
jgi:uncharacterized protein DUF4838